MLGVNCTTLIAMMSSNLLSLCDVPAQVRRQRANRLVDFVIRHTGLFRRLVDVITGNRLFGIKVGCDTVQVSRQHNPTELRVHFTEGSSMLVLLIVGQTRIDSAFFEELMCVLVWPLVD